MRAFSSARFSHLQLGRSIILTACGLLFGSVLLGGCGSGTPIVSTENRNVILIVVDTLRADATDGSWTATPAIHSLAADGIRFNKAFSHAPITLPAHAALFASRPPLYTGVLNNSVSVPGDVKLLAEWMRENGYQTHAVVSLGTLDPHTPKNQDRLARGFDHYDRDYWNMDLADRALIRMRRRLDAIDTERPFFLFAHFSDPHEPYNTHGQEPIFADILLDGELLERVPTSKMTLRKGELDLSVGRHVLEIRSPETFNAKILDVGLNRKMNRTVSWEAGERRKKVNEIRLVIDVNKGGTFDFAYWLSRPVTRRDVRERYKAEVEFVDRYVGDLLGELKARDLYDDSLILFTSDHGEALGEHGSIGHVQNLHDEMIHVPLIIKLPREHTGRTRLEREADRLVPQSDLVPTILDVIALDPMAGQMGYSLFGDRDRELVAETHKPESKRNFVCVRDERYKMIYDPDADVFTMFDMEQDSEENRDIFEDSRAERAEWPRKLRHIAETAAPGVVAVEDLSEEDMERLKALGYFGGDEED